MTVQVRTLRPLVESDIETLQEIDTAAHGRAWSHRTFLDDLEQPNRHHLVAEARSEIVGHVAAWIDGSSCRITNVAVRQGEYGHGHATAMLLALLDQVLGQVAVANLQLEVRPTNRRAQRMYSRFGFMPVGIERNFYDHRDEQGSTDAVVMAVPDVCAEPWRARLVDLRAAHDQSDSERDAGAAA